MDYLAKYEGDYVHMNRTEKDITSAYGIYRYAFPKADIFEWYECIAITHNISTNFKIKRNRKKLNELIKTEPYYKEIERDLAFDFYTKKFVNPTVANILDDKSALTYFSISVNGGKKTGAKALQYAIARHGVDIVEDGKIGHKTIDALKRLVGRNDYDTMQFNTYMIWYMRGFYARLIKRNPNKYAMYKRGWDNRLRGLA